MGPFWVDPRSGEILNASVYLYHDVIKLLNNWIFIQTAKQVDVETDLKAMYADLPFSMPAIERPVFPDYQVNICDFGAKSDGVTLNTEAINKAITTEVPATSTGDDKDIIHFFMDRPFLFMIKEKSTGLILFAGQITKL